MSNLKIKVDTDSWENLVTGEVVTSISSSSTDEQIPSAKCAYDKFAEHSSQIVLLNSNITNPNLLDNPWFTVNQRGFTTSSSTPSMYTVDRWMGSYGTNTANANGYSFTADRDNTGIRQRLDLSQIIGGNTYTISIKLQTGEIKTATITAQTTISEKNGYFDNDNNIKWELDLTSEYWQVWIYLKTASSIALRAIKFESGSISTLAMDTAPNYATELLKCQRYFVRIKSNHTHGEFGTGFVYSADTAFVQISLPIIMRGSGELSYSGQLGIFVSNGSYAVTNMILDSNTQFCPRLRVNSTGLTSGQGCLLIARGDANAYIDLSADL